MHDLALSLHEVSLGYRDGAVLEGVSLEVPRGQTFALLGRNGAGKTTLIRALMGLLPRRRGCIEVLGLDPAAQPLEVRRRVGYLAEDQQMYGWMTPAELCGFLAPFYPTWDNRLAAELLERFAIPRARRIKELSKGQNIRLGLALAHRPALVILDDPALGLDPISRKEFNRDVIEHLQGEGRTVFYSSHLLYEVEAIADTVAILDRQRIVRCGPTEMLVRDVKRVLLPRSAAAGLPAPETLLDVRHSPTRLAATVDAAARWIAALGRQGVEHAVEDLSLDEIFEAFVIGQPEGWPGQPSGRRGAVA